MTKKQELIIKLLEKAFSHPLSDEQHQIIRYGHKTNILVDACAGAGKTTLNTFDIMYNEACGVVNPHEILGITFARKARRAMQDKYRYYCKRFNHFADELGINVMINGTPTFQTFHSVFYQLLNGLYWQKYHCSLPVLLNWHQDRQMSRQIFFSIKDSSTKHLTKQKITKVIFDVRDKLIDLGYSIDGLHPIKRKGGSIKESHKVISSATHILYSNFVTDYRNVVKAYNQGKKRLGKIDFNDMKTMIADILSRPDTDPDKKAILARMSGFKYIYIDEFQDIDPVQWHNIRLLLPKEKDRRMTTIGDDDQSIYSFRGSDPTIIINLPKQDPSFKVFNLSTNYRTGGQIVKYIKPSIESNSERLPKSIHAYNHGGKVIQFRQSPANNAMDPEHSIIWKLIAMANDPKINNKDICLLARDNLSREVATDLLANHHIYPKIQGRFIIQDNYQYRSFCGLAEAIAYDNYPVFKKYSIRIGFNYYRRHQENVLKYAQKVAKGSSKPSAFHKLSEYLKYAGRYEVSTPLASIPYRRQNTERMARSHDHAVEAVLHLIYVDSHVNKGKHNHSLKNTFYDNIMEVLFNAVKNLIKGHDQFELKIGIAEQSKLDTISNQIANNMVSCQNPKEFFIKELTKEKRLSHTGVLNNSIQIMSIHQAKGLQFKYVFIYNLNDSLIQYPDILAERTFGPTCSWKHYINVLSSEDFHISLMSLSLNAGTNSALIAPLLAGSNFLMKLKRLFPEVFDAYKNYTDGATEQWIVKRFLDSAEFRKYFEGNSKFTKDKTDAAVKNLKPTYNDILQTSFHVEEERRLIYVAFTRAVKCVYYDLPNKFCPLLWANDWKCQKEVALDPRTNKFTNNVIPVKESDVTHV